MTMKMEIDGERYSKALELLRAASEICLTLMDTEVDRETVVNFRRGRRGNRGRNHGH